MTEVEQQILQTLLELEKSAAAMASANPKPNLLPLFTRLDDLSKNLPASADPQLRHYLQRKSYQKARVLLQGGVVPND